MHNKYTFQYLNLFLFLFSCLVFTGKISALEIRSFDANRHLRFLDFPSNPRHNPNFICASQDFSGVGWIVSDPRRQLTMVSPKHFVGAYHFRPGVGSAMRFLSNNNIVKDFTIASTINVPNADGTPSDLFIGTLNERITKEDGISFHPYLNLDSYLVSGDNEDDCFFESGDSGSPTFIKHNGIATIAGTNSLISRSLSGNSLNFVNFIPSYINEMNAIMENEGYRMTKAITDSTTLEITDGDQISLVPVGQSITLQINLENMGSEAENVQLRTEFPVGVNVTSISGSSWFTETSLESNIFNARRAQISDGETSQLEVTVTPTSIGLQNYTVTVSSDQSEPISHTLAFQVTSPALLRRSAVVNNPSGDDDQDGVSNLLEFAFGGDAVTASQSIADSKIPLLPVFTRGQNNSCQVAFIRRVDHVELAIDYGVTSSSSLTGDSFLDASTFITDTDVTPINNELELVTHTMQTPGASRFFRVEVTLNEKVALNE